MMLARPTHALAELGASGARRDRSAPGRTREATRRSTRSTPASCCRSAGSRWGGPRRWTISRTLPRRHRRQGVRSGSGSWASGRPARPGARSRARTRSCVEECRRVLPDLRDEDICGSPFAIVAYRVARRLRRRRGAGAAARAAGPAGSSSCCSTSSPTTPRPITRGCTSTPSTTSTAARTDLARAAAELRARRRSAARRRAILAYGRDPYFDGWPDTFQLNYRHAGFREARIAELGAIADRCDGVRCDMAMLLQPQIIQQTWGDRSRPADGSPPKDNPFWPEAIAAIKRRHPRLPVRRRGLLGHGVGAAAGRLRLHLRQAPLRSPGRPARPRRCAST